jgi:hypothetical protein
MEKYILIIDKKFDLEEKDGRLMMIASQLLRSGYKCTVRKSINHLESTGKNLSGFNLVFAHPDNLDTGILNKEIEKRGDFRVILYGTNAIKEYNDQENIRLRQSKQCLYLDWPEKEDFKKLIEEGW